MAEAALKLVEPEDIGPKALTYADIINRLPAIKNNDEYLYIGQLWKDGKALLEEISEGYDSLIKKAHELHKDAIAKKARYFVPVDNGVKTAKKLLFDYDAEQERIRKAEEERLRKLEEERLAEERRKEQERLETERKTEEDRLLNEALAAEQRGDAETAELLTTAAVESNAQINEIAATIAAEPIYVAPVVVPKAVPKMAGGPVYQTRWYAEVTDIFALCLAVGMKKTGVSIEYVMGLEKDKTGKISSPALNKMAVALKNTLNVPGVKSYSGRV